MYGVREPHILLLYRQAEVGGEQCKDTAYSNTGVVTAVFCCRSLLEKPFREAPAPLHISQPQVMGLPAAIVEMSQITLTYTPQLEHR